MQKIRLNYEWEYENNTCNFTCVKIKVNRNLALDKIDTSIPVREVVRFVQASCQAGCV